MAQQPDLSQHSIFITGAARGLGRSMAARLGACGARVALVDVDEAGVRAAAEALRAEGTRADPFAVDVSRRADVMSAAAAFAAGTDRRRNIETALSSGPAGGWPRPSLRWQRWQERAL